MWGLRTVVAPPWQHETAGQFLFSGVSPLGQYSPFPKCFVTFVLLFLLMVSLKASLTNSIRNKEEWTNIFTYNQEQVKNQQISNAFFLKVCLSVSPREYLLHQSPLLCFSSARKLVVPVLLPWTVTMWNLSSVSFWDLAGGSCLGQNLKSCRTKDSLRGSARGPIDAV